MKRLIAALALQLVVAGAATAVPYTVTIDTTALSGDAAQLVFDFIDAGPPANSVTISDFSTDGTLGAASTLGGVTGTLPSAVTLTDTDAFNEYLTDIILGTSISFVFTPTQNPPSGAFGDSFSIFLLDPTTGLPLFDTSDATGSGTLLLFSIDGTDAGVLSVFSVPPGTIDLAVAPVVQAVPLPGTAMLLLAGALGLALRRRKPA